MPELPEVDANRRNLAAWAEGRRITRVEPLEGKRQNDGLRPEEFRRRLEGRRVEAVDRRGKWILARLEGGAGMGLHLGMTGKLARAPERPRFTRAAFEMSDGGTIYFVDLRRFGRIWASTSHDELLARREIAEIGPDALAELDVRRLREALAGTSRTVKETIMDQRVLGGVGNLYATEALWRARIHPAAPSPKVAADAGASKRLAKGIRDALRHGIRTYEAEDIPEYIEEGAPNPFHAYDRQGEPCRRCGARLKAMTIGGRTSAFCPRCQKRS